MKVYNSSSNISKTRRKRSWQPTNNESAGWKAPTSRWTPGSPTSTTGMDGLSNRMDSMETQFSARMDAMEAKFDARFNTQLILTIGSWVTLMAAIIAVLFT